MRFLLPSFCLLVSCRRRGPRRDRRPQGIAPLLESHFRVELTLDLAGKVTIQQNDKAVDLKQSAQATHVYVERVLEAKDGIALKAGAFMSPPRRRSKSRTKSPSASSIRSMP